ncbi:MAG: hypothetical protein ISR59_00615 [Anaerolineales bacterium]|uniref:Peptidase M14 domain-containing protein n=1 Tax=Candidatus Desulfolinea nitratireducens TaxID=2841698 RepID=A0A8J6NIZ2_9CHLR|nr:hypothetical protein [Candidatus Desulfolinea nitratireducens]MBL6959579.1 hypothetical protein [Anaerolineales bacterium]
MAPKRKRTSIFLIGIWSLNIFGAIGLAGIFFFNQAENPFLPPPSPANVEIVNSPPPQAAALPASTSVQPPTIYFLPTITPNPRSTLIAAVTPTAFEFLVDTSKKQAAAIGYSVLGRPLEVFRFGNGPSERLIVAGIHGGNEWNTIALADELIAHLEEHPESVPENVSLYILRSLNPDGEARAHGYEGRANENGVDLNHNWPYHWKAEWDRKGCWKYLPLTAGTHPASEPETIALMNFISLHDFDALISYHSAALGIFAGGLPPFAPSERLAKSLSNISPYTYPPIDTGCDYSGNLADWVSSVKGIPSVDIELLTHEYTDFDVNLRVLKVFLNWQP